jgi:hypothetical protein
LGLQGGDAIVLFAAPRQPKHRSKQNPDPADCLPPRHGRHGTRLPERTSLVEDAPDNYEVHRQDLAPGQVTWWEGIPTVATATAIK